MLTRYVGSIMFFFRRTPYQIAKANSLVENDDGKTLRFEARILQDCQYNHDSHSALGCREQLHAAIQLLGDLDLPALIVICTPAAALLAACLVVVIYV